MYKTDNISKHFLFNKNPMVIFLGFALVCAGIDQGIKQWVQATLNPYDVIEITSFFNIRFSYNTGVSFSLLSSFGENNVWGLIALNVALVTLLLYWGYKAKKTIEVIGYSLIVGGALGNIVDRIIIGAVVDYLDFHYGGWHFPTFNGADSFITLGVMVLLWDGIFGKKML